MFMVALKAVTMKRHPFIPSIVKHREKNQAVTATLIKRKFAKQ